MKNIGDRVSVEICAFNRLDSDTPYYALVSHEDGITRWASKLWSTRKGAYRSAVGYANRKGFHIEDVSGHEARRKKSKNSSNKVLTD
jgi:hypothetical protein